MPYGMHQMGLSKTYASVYEKRIVSLCGRLGHRYAGSMCEPVAVTYYECIKRVFRIKTVRRVVL